MPADVTGSDEDDSVFLRRVKALARVAAVLARDFTSTGTRRVFFPRGGRSLHPGSARGPLGRAAGKAPRERSIAVRMKQPQKTFQTTPENVGKEKGLYAPWVEKLWNLYEGDLIRVADDLEAGALQQGDEAYLLLHISALKPRKASFLDDLNDYQTNNGLPLFTETDLPIERVKAVLRTLPYAGDLALARASASQGGEVHHQRPRPVRVRRSRSAHAKDWPSHGVFFPLGPAAGVLGFLHEPTLHRRVFRPLDFSERLMLNRGYTALLNLRLWEDAERFVVAHPDHRDSVPSLDLRRARVVSRAAGSCSREVMACFW
jgi:hypothetical protein